MSRKYVISMAGKYVKEGDKTKHEILLKVFLSQLIYQIRSLLIDL